MQQVKKVGEQITRNARYIALVTIGVLFCNPIVDIALAFGAHFIAAWIALIFTGLAGFGILIGGLVRLSITLSKPHCEVMSVDDAECDILFNLVYAAFPLFGLWDYTIYFANGEEANAWSHAPRFDGADMLLAGRFTLLDGYWIDGGSFTSEEDDHAKA